MSTSASVSLSAPKMCPTSLRYDEPKEGGAYCSGGARTEVLQQCCAQVGKYDCMKNKCYMPEAKQAEWRHCIQTEVFVCTASASPRRTKSQVLALALGLTVALLGVAAGT